MFEHTDSLTQPVDQFEASMELVYYNAFYRNNIVRRTPDLNRVWDTKILEEFPTQVVNHIDDNFNMDKPITFVPDTKGLLFDTRLKIKYLHHILFNIDDGPYRQDESFIMPSIGVIQSLMSFKSKNMKDVRIVGDYRKLPFRNGVQNIISYNSLYRARIFGLLRSHRRVKFILGNIVNMISKIPDRHHFIKIPINPNKFTKQDFIRTFDGFNRSTIKHPEDKTYLFLMHLIAFMHDKPTDSVFEKIPQNMWQYVHFILTAGSKCVVYNLQELKKLNKEDDVILVRLLQQMTMLGDYGKPVDTARDFADAAPEIDTSVKVTSDDIKNTSLYTTTEEEIAKDTNEVSYTTKPDESKTGNVVEQPTVIFKEVSLDKVLEPKKEEPKKDDVVKSSLTKPMTNPWIAFNKPAKKTKVPNQDDIKKSLYESEIETKKLLSGITPVTVEIDPKLLEVKKDKLNIPSFDKPVEKKVQEKFNNTYVDELDVRAESIIENAVSLTDRQKVAVKELSQAYKKITINEKETVEDILLKPVDTSVSEEKLDFLEDEVIDDSMLKSSCAKFEQQYMDKMFQKDLVSELVSFNSQGMFLTDLKKEDLSDPLNNVVKYVASYEDVNRKKHTIKFILPKIDERGFCYVNGTYKVLKKQRVALPICKVSSMRVALSSDFNKYLVERSQAVAHNFYSYVNNLIGKASVDDYEIVYGSFVDNSKVLPYEYTALSSRIVSLKFKSHKFTFDYPNRFDDVDEKDIKFLNDIEKSDSLTYVGRSNKSDYFYFFNLSGEMHVYKNGQKTAAEQSTFIDFLCEILGVSSTGLNEWVDFKILNKSIPLIFTLCYRFGLSNMLNYTKANYKVYNSRERFIRKVSDIVIRFADKKIVIPRSPLTISLLFAGLNNFDLTDITLEEMDSKDIYYDLIQQQRLSIHMLKGIDSFFDMFIDPITRDVLFQMGEPTNPRDLLIRATQLLTTEDHKPAASCCNFRFRSYERINAAVYNTLSRAFTTFKYKSIGASNKFSIPDFEVKQMIVQDQLMENVDVINPINDIKYSQEYSHAGFGGRTVDTFMLNDRRFPDDGLGVMSEATVDSSKVGVMGNLSTDPSLVNLRGLTITKDKEEVKPTNMLSITSILVPGVTNDDGKRSNFVNIQMSHYVPTKDGDVSRIKTGYEKIVAHRTKLPFAYAAEEDGSISNIDQESKILIVKYKSGKTKAVNFGEEYFNNGGGGFYTTQSVIINNFKKGDKVKKGDIIIYNDKFFKPDIYSKQVEWKIGVLANVALIDCGTTMEDSSVLTPKISKQLEFEPVHVRDIVLKKDTRVHKYASIGTELLSTDILLAFDESEMTDDMFGGIDETAVDLLTKLNRITPKAKFTGKVVKIEAYHKCNTDEMSKSIRAIVNTINKPKELKEELTKNCDNSDSFHSHSKVVQSDRIGLNDITDDNIILRFYIQQKTDMNAGDKLVVDSSLKSIPCSVLSGEIDVEDKSTTVDVLFSARSQSARIIMSPLIQGTFNKILEETEQRAIDMYFK